MKRCGRAPRPSRTDSRTKLACRFPPQPWVLTWARGRTVFCLASGLTHPQKRARLHQQGCWSFARLLAVDIAIHHPGPLSVSGLPVIDVTQTLLVNAADGTTQEVTEIDVTVRKNKHRSQSDVAVSLFPAQVQASVLFAAKGANANECLDGGIFHVMHEPLELLLVADYRVVLALQIGDFLKNSSQGFRILDPMGIVLHSHKGLKINLNLRVLAKVSHQVRQCTVVLLYDRCLDDDADSGPDPLLFRQHILNAVENTTRSVGHGSPEILVDFGIHRLQ